MSLDLGQCSDGELAALALGGQERAYREFLRRYRDPVYRLVRNTIRDSEEALDVTQESFVSAFAALKRYDRERPFKLWISRIAINKCRDWARRRAVRSFFTRAQPIEDCLRLGKRRRFARNSSRRPRGIGPRECCHRLLTLETPRSAHPARNRRHVAGRGRRSVGRYRENRRNPALPCTRKIERIIEGLVFDLRIMVST